MTREVFFLICLLAITILILVFPFVIVRLWKHERKLISKFKSYNIDEGHLFVSIVGFLLVCQGMFFLEKYLKYREIRYQFFIPITVNDTVGVY